MRIRSIRPEFWTSEDIAALDWATRLIYIGLWSYVDDNGVGRDVPKLIAADLFPLDEDTHGALMKVTGALKSLQAGGQIDRYEVDGKPLLHVKAWTTHQVINRPSKGRYPLPTCENAVRHNVDDNTHGVLHEHSTPGEGEKGRRGEVRTPSSADADGPTFEDFWKLYPRKVEKIGAKKAWPRAVKAAGGATVILQGLQRQLPTLGASEPQFIPHPTTWLNNGRWDDAIDGVSEDGTLTPEAVDQILGRETFQLPRTPEGIEEGTREWQQWARGERDRWREDRARRAAEIQNRRAS